MPKYNLKVGKDSFDVEHTAQQTYQDFQAKVFALTDIPPKNLKVLFKGKMIKDNQTLFAVPNLSQLIVMGTKAGKELKQTGDIKIQTIMIQQPKKQSKFGLKNIGNTCYINASIQFLKSVPAIHDLLINFKEPKNNKYNVIANTLSTAVKEMQKKDSVPKLFVAYFLQTHPEFKPLGQQHDADEFMQRLIQDLSNSGNNHKLFRDTFQIQLLNTVKNTQIQQPTTSTLQITTKIGCSLGGNDKQTKVGTLYEGIKYGLVTKIEKKSLLDNMNHIYESQSKFASLPPFLIVQMVRFFWKQVNDPDSQFNKSQATKICRVIDFGNKIDLFDLCTEQLKGNLLKGRQAYEQNKKRDEQAYKKAFDQYKNSMKETNRPESRLAEEFKEKWRANQKPLTEGLQTGVYELHAVVTHLGNSVDSGHYMAWTKQSESQWIKYDDDTVYPQPEEKVFQLRGGQPNLEIAYLLMFRKVYTRPL